MVKKEEKLKVHSPKKTSNVIVVEIKIWKRKTFISELKDIVEHYYWVLTLYFFNPEIVKCAFNLQEQSL